MNRPGAARGPKGSAFFAGAAKHDDQVPIRQSAFSALIPENPHRAADAA
jgi:hypothetical protein